MLISGFCLTERLVSTDECIFISLICDSQFAKKVTSSQLRINSTGLYHQMMFAQPKKSTPKVIYFLPIFDGKDVGKCSCVLVFWCFQLSIRDNKFIGVGLGLEMRHTTFQRKRSFNVILMSNIVPDDNFRSCMCGKDSVIRSASECTLILAIRSNEA